MFDFAALYSLTCQSLSYPQQAASSDAIFWRNRRYLRQTGGALSLESLGSAYPSRLQSPVGTAARLTCDPFLTHGLI
jgi:hypothetical protein